MPGDHIIAILSSDDSYYLPTHRQPARPCYHECNAPIPTIMKDNKQIMHRASKKNTPRQKREKLVTRFLDEVLATVNRERTHAAASDALRKGYFAGLRPYQQWGDFQFRGKLPRPRPLELYVEPYTLYGYFRAWLRKQRIDPETLPLPEKSE
jgi:hypothetical protein